MKNELLKKMKYEMPGAAKGKGKPMPEETEIEISMGPESADEEGLPELAEVDDQEMMAEGQEEMEGLDLSSFSDEELQAELDKRMAKPAPGKSPAKMA